MVDRMGNRGDIGKSRWRNRNVLCSRRTLWTNHISRNGEVDRRIFGAQLFADASWVGRSRCPPRSCQRNTNAQVRAFNRGSCGDLRRNCALAGNRSGDDSFHFGARGWCNHRGAADFCGLAYLIPQHLLWRRFLEAIFWRWIDLLSWAVRYAAVFAMLGVDLSPESAASAACIAAAANMIPFLGNGLGVREWAIGLAGPALATWTTDTGLAAELINRCLDLVVVVPLGLVVMPGIAKRIRTASKGKTSPDMASKIGS